MRTVRGNPYFTETCSDTIDYHALEQNIETDVLIVGGGVTGAFCAYAFSKLGISTVLIDKRRIGYGSTSITTALLQYELDEDLYTLGKKIDMTLAVRGYEFSKKGLAALDSLIIEIGNNCEYVKRPTLYYTDEECKVKGVQKEFELRKHYGFSVEYIDDKTKHGFSFPLLAGVYDEEGGAEINPFILTKQLIQHSVAKGVRVFEHTEVVEYQHSEKYVTVQTKKGPKITAKKVIVATGYDTKLFTHKKFGKLYTTYNLVSAPVKSFIGWEDNCLIRTAEETYTYLRTTPDGRIIIGGEDTRHIPELLEGGMAVSSYDNLRNRLMCMFPHFHNDIDYYYNGAFITTKDNLPYIGPDRSQPNIWFCLGYGANGLLYGLLGSQILSDLYQGNPVKDLELVDFNRK